MVPQNGNCRDLWIKMEVEIDIGYLKNSKSS